MSAAEHLTITAQVRMSRYARVCLWLARWLAPISHPAAQVVARQAWVWVKLDGCGVPGDWTRHNVGAYLDWSQKHEKVSR
jgi:hypothetical protein